MRIVGLKNGGTVSALVAGAIAAQLGATWGFAETRAHKATTSCPGGSTSITLPNGFCDTIFARHRTRPSTCRSSRTRGVAYYYGNDASHEGGILVAGFGIAPANV